MPIKIQNIFNEMKKDEMELFNIKSFKSTAKYKHLNESCIYSLIFIVSFLEQRGVTLTHICLNDFEVHDQALFLVKDTHIVELYDETYIYEPLPKEKVEFIPDDIQYKNHKTILYKSVGLFMFYLITKKIRSKISNGELEELYYSKPYFFIKNAMDTNDPCLIYL
jgi:hypothetical protein